MTATSEHELSLAARTDPVRDGGGILHSYKVVCVSLVLRDVSDAVAPTLLTPTRQGGRAAVLELVVSRYVRAELAKVWDGTLSKKCGHSLFFFFLPPNGERKKRGENGGWG